MLRHRKMHDINDYLPAASTPESLDIGQQLNHSDQFGMENPPWTPNSSITELRGVEEMDLGQAHHSGRNELMHENIAAVTNGQRMESEAYSPDSTVRDSLTMQGTSVGGIERVQDVQLDFQTNIEGQGEIPWNLEHDVLSASWLLGYDFNVDELSTAVTATQNATARSINNADCLESLHLSPTVGCHNVRHIQQKAKERWQHIERAWFTHIGNLHTDNDGDTGPHTRLNTPLTSEGYGVDDGFRARMTSRLNSRMLDDTLPSTDYLVRNRS